MTKWGCVGGMLGSVANYCAVFDLSRCYLNLIVPFLHRVGIKKTALCGGFFVVVDSVKTILKQK